MSPLRPIVLWVLLAVLALLAVTGCAVAETSPGLPTPLGVPADSTALAPTPDASPTAPPPISTPEPPVPDLPTPASDCLGPNTQTYENEVLGAVIAYPGGYEIIEDEFLSNEYGFSLVAADRNPILDVEWRRLNAAGDVARVVDEELRAYAGLPIGQAQTEVDGRPATMLSGVPGEVANTVLYVPVGERLYALRYYREKLDDAGVCLIGTIRFITPIRSLEDLDLTPAADVVYVTPTALNTRLPVTYETSVDYGVAWAVPEGWREVTDDVPPSDGVLIKRAWSPDAAIVDILSGARTATDEGGMLLSLSIVNDGDLPFPPPGSQSTGSIPDQPMYAREVMGEQAAPFAYRLRITAKRSPYQYNLEMGCLPPAGADEREQGEFEAECRLAWAASSGPFSLCTLPRKEPISGVMQDVTDRFESVHFEVPIEWYVEQHQYSELLLIVYADPVPGMQPSGCRWPNGFIKIDLYAQALDAFAPEDGPDLTGYEEIAGTRWPVWITVLRDESGEVYGDGALIRGPGYWYTLYLYCDPPAEADETGETAFRAACDAHFAHVLQTFEIR